MAATFEVESKMNTVGEIAFQLRKGGWKTRQPDDTKNAEKQDNQDEHELPLKLRTHAGSLAFLGLGLESGDGAARDLDLHLVGDAQLHGIVLEPNDRAVNAAVGDHFVAVLQIPKHFGDLFLPALRRQDHQDIEDHYNQYDRKETKHAAEGRRSGRLQSRSQWNPDAANCHVNAFFAEAGQPAEKAKQPKNTAPAFAAPSARLGLPI
jgi:hypothetical protein